VNVLVKKPLRSVDLGGFRGGSSKVVVEMTVSDVDTWGDLVLVESKPLKTVGRDEISEVSDEGGSDENICKGTHE
jgi:hypothetical protein